MVGRIYEDLGQAVGHIYSRRRPEQTLGRRYGLKRIDGSAGKMNVHWMLVEFEV
jgi:hypothetical protein